MKTIYYIVALSLVLLLGTACGNRKSADTSAQLSEVVFDDIEPILPEGMEDISEAPAFRIPANVQYREYPFRDSTNFDNYPKTCVELSPAEIEEMSLEELIPEGTGFMRNYAIELPGGYKGIAISYHLSDMELYTTLFSCKDGKFIDKLNVAFDEVAESWFRKESNIYEDHIVVYDYNYIEEPAEVTETEYHVNSDGTFVVVH